MTSQPVRLLQGDDALAFLFGGARPGSQCDATCTTDCGHCKGAGPARTVEVDRIVEQERNGTITHEVQLQLTPVQWRMLLGDVARAFYRARTAGLPVTSVMFAAGRPESDLDREDALTRFQQLLNMPRPAWLLSPDEADRVASELLVAAEEPETLACGCLDTGRKACGWHR